MTVVFSHTGWTARCSKKCSVHACYFGQRFAAPLVHPAGLLVTKNQCQGRHQIIERREFSGLNRSTGRDFEKYEEEEPYAAWRLQFEALPFLIQAPLSEEAASCGPFQIVTVGSEPSKRAIEHCVTQGDLLSPAARRLRGFVVVMEIVSVNSVHAEAFRYAEDRRSKDGGKAQVSIRLHF